jgi:AcrR family transcriptional regulator
MTDPMSAAETPSRRPARDKIFKAAKDLFYRYGIRAVGVDSIAAEAGTTKMSLYRSFESKDELVAECLQEHQREFWKWWDEMTAPFAGEPKRQLLAVMEGFAEHSRDEHRGCPLANAIVELHEEQHPARAVVLEHRTLLRQRLLELCKQAKAREPSVLADALLLLIEGSHITRLTFTRGGSPSDSLSPVARTLIEAHIAG